MKTLDRYIIRSFFTNLALCLSVILALRIVMDLSINMDEFAKQEVSFGRLAGWIGKYYACHSLVYFTELGGVAIGIAAAFTIARMNASNELTAMMASGVSLRRVLLPIVICSVLVSLLVVVDREFVVPLPRIRGVLARDRDDMAGQEGIRVRLMDDGSRSVWWSNRLVPGSEKTYMMIMLRGDGRTQEEADRLVKQTRQRDEGYYKTLYRALARVSGYSPVQGRLGNERGWVLSGTAHRPAGLYVLTAGPAWHRPPTTSAIWTSLPAGRIVAAAQGGTAALPIVDAHYGLTIDAEAVVVRPPAPNAPPRVTLRRPVFTFQTPGKRVLGRFLADSATLTARAGRAFWTLRNGKLFYPTDMTMAEMRLRESGQHLDYASSAELMELVKLERVPDRRGVIFAKHLRIAEPLNGLVMLLVGVPFILSRERNVKASVLMCLAMSVLFYAFVYGSRYVDLPPVWSAWLPVLVFGPVAAVMVDAIKT